MLDLEEVLFRLAIFFQQSLSVYFGASSWEPTPTQNTISPALKLNPRNEGKTNSIKAIPTTPSSSRGIAEITFLVTPEILQWIEGSVKIIVQVYQVVGDFSATWRSLKLTIGKKCSVGELVSGLLNFLMFRTDNFANNIIQRCVGEIFDTNWLLHQSFTSIKTFGLWRLCGDKMSKTH